MIRLQTYDTGYDSLWDDFVVSSSYYDLSRMCYKNKLYSNWYTYARVALNYKKYPKYIANYILSVLFSTYYFFRN